MATDLNLAERRNMNDQEDDSDDDIEALLSRANELTCQFENELSGLVNMEEVCLGDGDAHSLHLHGDYDSITTCDGDCLPHDDFEGSDDLLLSPSNDFNLTERTSNIISSYRNYLTEIEVRKDMNERLNEEALVSSYRDYLMMEAIAAKNQSLIDEMTSIKNSLDLNMGAPDPPSRADFQHSIEIHEEEPRSYKYSRPLLHSRRLKKRLRKATVAVAIMGSLAAFSFYQASTYRNRNVKDLPKWDAELAQSLQEDSESSVNEGLLEEVSSRIRPSMKDVQVRDQLSTQPPYRTKSKDENSAINIIQDLTAHPKLVSLTSSPGETDEEKNFKGVEAFTESGKSSTKSTNVDFSKSETNTKSAKRSSTKSAKSSSTKSVKNTSSTTTRMNESGHTPAPTATALLDSFTSAVQKENEAKAVRLHLESADILYQAISSQYEPMFYDRSRGWEGTSFVDALKFCNRNYPNDGHEQRGVPCPYEVYCPEGPKTIPFGGYQRSYAPIIDNKEHWLGWVQLDHTHPCETYSHLKPDARVQHILCCKNTGR